MLVIMANTLTSDKCRKACNVKQFMVANVTQKIRYLIGPNDTFVMTLRNFMPFVETKAISV